MIQDSGTCPFRLVMAMKRCRQDLHIHPERHVPDVLKIVGNPLVEIAAIAAMPANLPQPGDAGPDRQSGFPPRDAQLVLPERRRAWTDQAHLTEHDVEQLWQLVQAGRPAASVRLGSRAGRDSA